MDDLKEGEVAVFACGGPTDRIAPWGELLSMAARARGAAGGVTDGLVRDIRAIRALGFPVFHGGIGPLDSKGRGKMMDADVPVGCGGVLVTPGDWVFGDADGVVVIPAGAAEEAFATALAKVESETTTRDELAAGEKLADVFRRHGSCRRLVDDRCRALIRESCSALRQPIFPCGGANRETATSELGG